MKKVIILIIAFLFTSCNPYGDYIVYYKRIDKEQNGTAIYLYGVGGSVFEIRDSINKYEIGEDVRRYNRK